MFQCIRCTPERTRCNYWFARDSIAFFPFAWKCSMNFERISANSLKWMRKYTYKRMHSMAIHPIQVKKKKQYKIHLNANNARIFAKLSLTRAPVAVVVVLFVFASLAISLTVVIRLSGSWKTIVILICLRIVYGTLNPLVHVKWFRS